MKSLTIKEIIEQTKAEVIQLNPKTTCENFSKDTRTIQKGDTYIAIKGANFDGNKFWEQALEKGADCVIVSEISYTEETLKKYPNKTILKVQDTLEALYKIARLKRNKYKIPVIAITGSVGKTSTKDIVANVVSQKYKTLKTEGNNNNNIGLPFTILKLKDHEALVVEMGMNHLGEISLLTSIAKPNICIITNIGTSHIGNLGSRENILKAKLEILEGNENATIIINNDNDLLHKWKNEYKLKAGQKLVTYGINEESNIMATNINLKKEKSTFQCNMQNSSFNVTVPVGGEHFVLNALCAASVGEILNIENEKIRIGIEKFELTKKRMDIVELKNNIKIINDAYNASLESMKASLENMAEYKENRKIAVLGDMFELGEFAPKLHEQVGEAVYKNKIDVLICSGKEAINIANGAKKAGMPEKQIYYMKDKEEITKKLKQILETGDIVLLKASNGMRFFDLVEKLQ